MRHTKAGLTCIVSILRDLNIPFEIDGGLAAEMYGTHRELADIDINVPGDRFDEIVPHVKDYLHFGPAWYRDDHWEVYMMSMKFAGQNIDIDALGKMRFFDKDAALWRDISEDLSDVRIMKYMDMELPFINEMKLMIYKQELARGVDRKDVAGMVDQLKTEWRQSDT